MSATPSAQEETPAPEGAGTDRVSPATRLLRRLNGSGLLLMLPAVVGMTLLFVVPMIRIGYQSLTQKQAPTGEIVHGFGFGNYTSLFTDGFTSDVVVRTLVLGVVVALVTVCVGYPYAYAMTLVGPRMRILLITVVLVPLWTSALARSFTWVVLFQADGLVDRLFGVVLKGTIWAVGLAMTQVLLPFAILPLYTRMSAIDRRILAAAQSLGANRFRAFVQVYLPVSLPGVVTAATLVFILSLGFYLTPALVGSSQDAVVAQLIVLRAQTLDFGGAGALGILVLILTLLVVGISAAFASRFDGSGRGRGAAVGGVGGVGGSVSATGASLEQTTQTTQQAPTAAGNAAPSRPAGRGSR